VDPQDLSGDWTYRSFRNAAELVADFNDIRLAQTDMQLQFGADGSVRGVLSFPAGAADADKGFMDLEGRVLSREPLRVQFRGRGREGTRSWNYEYAYDGILSPAMPGAVDQRPVLAGTVMRVRERTGGATPAPAGMTATFAAVKRE
jgi:hypothetical protein